MHDWRRDGCEICGARSTGYYDITMTGIGHFLFHCANEEHRAECSRYRRKAEQGLRREKRMDAKLHTASHGGSIVVHHMTKAQVLNLHESFAYPVQLEDGSLGWHIPEWLLAMMEHATS